MLSAARGQGTFCAVDVRDAATANHLSFLLRNAGNFLLQMATFALLIFSNDNVIIHFYNLTKKSDEVGKCITTFRIYCIFTLLHISSVTLHCLFQGKRNFVSF